MKIFYAVQATGNGHISRAMELLPYLKQYGSVDIFLSGNNGNLDLDAPVRYRSKGLSLYYNCRGGLDFWQFATNFEPRRLRQEIRDLPVEKYDLVINDFDYITAKACERKNKPSVNFGHQASFISAAVPRPSIRSKTGEWVLRNYAPATRYVGLHFNCYDQFIFPAVVKQEILEAAPSDKGYVTVYLPSFCEPQLTTIFSQFPDLQFELFSGQTTRPHAEGNLRFLPVNRELFNRSLINCTGIITGGGFETPAEALHLGKKLLSIPIKSQYEQQCNAAALQQMGVRTLMSIGIDFKQAVHEWLNDESVIRMDYSNSVSRSLEYLFDQATEDIAPPVMN